MIGRILTASAAAALAILPVAASAQTVSPNGPFTLSGTGITVSKGITLSCGLTGSGNVTSGVASISSIAFTGSVCSSISVSGGPFSVTVNASAGTITINNLNITAITGSCRGSLTGTIAAGVITFNNATIPSTTGGSACRISGRVNTSPALSI